MRRQIFIVITKKEAARPDQKQALYSASDMRQDWMEGVLHGAEEAYKYVGHSVGHKTPWFSNIERARKLAELIHEELLPSEPFNIQKIPVIGFTGNGILILDKNGSWAG